MTREQLDTYTDEQLIDALHGLDIIVPQNTERWRLIGMLLGDCEGCQEDTAPKQSIQATLTMIVKNSKRPPKPVASMGHRPANKPKKPCAGCGKTK
jgi:hypothetical protein